MWDNKSPIGRDAPYKAGEPATKDRSHQFLDTHTLSRLLTKLLTKLEIIH